MKTVDSRLWLIIFVIFIGVLVTGSIIISAMHMGFGLIWLLIVIIAIYFLASEKDTKEILEKRYARGEISRKQYMQMKKDLR